MVVQRKRVLSHSMEWKCSIHTVEIVTGNWNKEKQPHRCRKPACCAACCWTITGMLLRIFCHSKMSLQHMHLILHIFHLFLLLLRQKRCLSIQPTVRTIHKVIQFMIQTSLDDKFRITDHLLCSVEGVLNVWNLNAKECDLYQWVCDLTRALLAPPHCST